MAQRFIIDQIGKTSQAGSFCIPYAITNPDSSSAPPTGKISFINNSNSLSVDKTEYIRVSFLTDLEHDIKGYLTSSRSGVISLYAQDDPNDYAIFSYVETTS